MRTSPVPVINNWDKYRGKQLSAADMTERMRHGLLYRGSPSQRNRGQIWLCRACRDGWNTLVEAQEHDCMLEADFRVYTGITVPGATQEAPQSIYAWKPDRTLIREGGLVATGIQGLYTVPLPGESTQDTIQRAKADVVATIGQSMADAIPQQMNV